MHAELMIKFVAGGVMRVFPGIGVTNVGAQVDVQTVAGRTVDTVAAFVVACAVGMAGVGVGIARILGAVAGVVEQDTVMEVHSVEVYSVEVRGVEIEIEDVVGNARKLVWFGDELGINESVEVEGYGECVLPHPVGQGR